MHTTILGSAMALSLVAAAPGDRPTEPTDNAPLVQLAILLDTSGSMKGLVDQARCQFWEVVDQLATARRGGERVRLEVGVYEYGNSKADKSRGYVHRVLAFSDDLDAVSRALFSLDLEGGDEYCATAIGAAVDELDWSDSTDAFRAVVIAGNESFDQGDVRLESVLPVLEVKDITLNTIYCRWKKAKQGEHDRWSEAADRAFGRFLEIDHNIRMRDIATPYDDTFREMNDRMNGTFVWYGKNADKARRNQLEQDENARKLSNRAFASRMAAKIGHLYHHVHDDLVDAVQHGHAKLEEMDPAKMPERLQAMTEAEREIFIAKKIADRERVRRDMADLITKRHRFLVRESHGKPENDAATWGDAFTAAIRAQAEAKGFAFDGMRGLDAVGVNR